MTMEVRELLSWVALHTSEHASGSSTLKGMPPWRKYLPLLPLQLKPGGLAVMPLLQMWLIPWKKPTRL